MVQSEIRQVRASTITGNVLVLFDPARLATSRLLSAIARAAAGRDTPGKPSERGAMLEPEAWHAMDLREVISRVSADGAGGLTSAEAMARLASGGPNTLPTSEPKSALAIVAGHLTTLPVLLLGGAAVLSLASGGLLDAGAILAVIACNAAVGYVTESRVERILASMQDGALPLATVRRDGRDVIVPAAGLVPGDVLVLRAGEAVSADARITSAEALTLDESTLTGESLPATKSVAPVAFRHTPLAGRACMVFAGTVVSEGAGTAVVTATGARTELGRLRALVAEASAPRTPLERDLDGMGRRLVGASLGLCGLALGLGLLRGIPALEMVRSVISLAVAAVPEGLPAVATTTLALGVQRMMANRTLVRRLAAVEALGATTVICADKTGTLTENRMAVHSWVLGGREYRPAAPGGAPGEPDQLLARALAVGVLCNDAGLDAGAADGNGLGSATEHALLAGGLGWGVDYRALQARYPRRQVQPRAEGANWMATVHGTPAGRQLVAVKGAPEEVLALASRWADGGGELPLAPDARARILSDNARLASRGMRVLGLAYREIAEGDSPAFEQLVWVGLVALRDPVRAGVRGAVAACRAAGIRTVMITGDQAATAEAIYRALDEARESPPRVCDGGTLGGLDDAALLELVRQVDVFARVSPADKHRIVRALQADGHVVAMTGDGVNDAAALRAADIGVAMGGRGTEMARDVADVVLLDDDLGGIVAAVAQGRAIHANIGRSLRFLLATNFSEILVTLAALGLGLGRPLSAIQLLWINLLSDVFPALALAVEPPAADVMQRPPRDPAAPILDRAALRGIAGDAALLSAGALGVHGLARYLHGAGPLTNTMTFTALTAGQLIYARACRAPTAGERPSGLLDGVVAGSLALQLATVLLPPLRRVLGTAPLGLADWALVAAGAAVPALLVRERPDPLMARHPDTR